jgi:disulfide bond formation protein DsbB
MAPIRSAALLSILGGLAALAAAFAAEWWGHLVPCALCLLERWPYRIVVGLGVVAFVLPPRACRALLRLALLALLGGLVLAVVHVGVEQGFWPSPLPECAAPHLSGSIADRLAQMPLRPEMPCGTPVFPLAWLPLSLAALDLLYTLAFCLFLLISVARPIPRRRAGRRGYA